MKCLLTIFLLSYALQPLQLQACDMQESPGAHHAAMQDDGGHDCCDSGQDGNTGECESMVSCGSGPAGPSLPQEGFLTSVFDYIHHDTLIDDNRLAAPHTAPPYRPPIA